MKPKFLSKLKKLGQQVEPLRQFVENAPSQAARIREAVVLTAGQLQQLRSEIQTGITDLRADSGDHLLRSLAEIGDSTGILRQAGFELTGVDLELGLTVGQRFLLQLRRVEEVPAAMVRALATANPDRPALRGVLAALQRAIELEDTVDLPNLEFRQLTVAVGPVPSIRIGWRPELGVETSAVTSAPEPEPEPVPTTQAFGTAPPLLAPRSSAIPAPESEHPAGPRIPSTGALDTVRTTESRPRPPLPQAPAAPPPSPSLPHPDSVHRRQAPRLQLAHQRPGSLQEDARPHEGSLTDSFCRRARARICRASSSETLKVSVGMGVTVDGFGATHFRIASDRRD